MKFSSRKQGIHIIAYYVKTSNEYHVIVIVISLTQNVLTEYVHVIIAGTLAKNNSVHFYTPSQPILHPCFPSQNRSRQLHETLKCVNGTGSQDKSKTPPFLNYLPSIVYAT